MKNLRGIVGFLLVLIQLLLFPLNLPRSDAASLALLLFKLLVYLFPYVELPALLMYLLSPSSFSPSEPHVFSP